MNLDRKLFWDVDYDKLDWEKYASWVIVRVFERGDVDDIRQVRRHYGDEKISDSLLNAKSIRLDRLYLAAAVIDQPLEKFKCYLNQQLNPKLFRF
ncbi:MAG: DUF6922 domain-containing protein [Bacteroidia bacterium]|jgi:hypothetical protein